MIGVDAYTLTCACGTGLEALRASLRERRSGLRANDFPHSGLATWIGRVEGVDELELPAELRSWESRNNRLALLGLGQDDFLQHVDEALARWGADRVAVVVGTSTSSIGRTEAGYRELDGEGQLPAAYLQPEVHNPHSPAAFAAAFTGARGPAITISTACSSSAKTFATAHRWLTAGLADAVLVGGVDSLCLSVLHGFHSLELLSSRPCRPFDQARDGISLGEAAGFALLSRQSATSASPIALTGYGESADAHHMSHPHPEGLGAGMAMDAALARAGLEPDQIDYVNLHGTASRANDFIEAQALGQRFGGRTIAGSTKGWTGHALGAAGIVEAVIAMDALTTGLVPGTLNTETLQDDLAYPITLDNSSSRPSRVMSNSFGFGGSNCSIIFEACR